MWRQSWVRQWVCLLVLACGAGAVCAFEGSGFISDYSQLKPTLGARGVERQLWVVEGANLGRYQKVMLDPVVYYPEPKSGERVSAEALAAIRVYLDERLRDLFAARLTVVGEPGPDVARIRFAVTAVSSDTSFKPYQLIPVALLFSAVKHATGNASPSVKLMIECEIVDSQTGLPVLRVVRGANKIALKDHDSITLEAIRPNVEEWSEVAREEIENHWR